MANLTEDDLTDEDLDALAKVFQPASVQSLRADDLDGLEDAVITVDDLISIQPELSAPLKVYKKLDGGEALRGRGPVTEGAYFSASIAKPASGFVVSMEIPAGKKVLMFDDGTVVTNRGFKFRIPAEGDEGSLQAAGLTIEEFHQSHDQRVHGGGSAGGMSTPTREQILASREKRLRERETRLQKQAKTERKAERRRKLNSVINGIAAVTAVAGLLLATGVVTTTDVQRGAQKTRASARRGAENIKRRRNAARIKRMM